MNLPHILIIDDVLGKRDNEAGRLRFCKALQLKDAASSVASAKDDQPQYLAKVSFESGQNISSDGAVSNDKDKAIRAIERGWPFPDGSRWALVCLDLEFVVGSRDRRTTELFGVKLLQAIEEKWRTKNTINGNACEIPAVMLSSHDPEVVEKQVHQNTDVQFLDKWTEGDPSRFLLEMGKILFKASLALDGTLRRVDEKGEVHEIKRESPILGCSFDILSALRAARVSLLRGRDARVLVMAERGAGKELLARYLHDHAVAAATYINGQNKHAAEGAPFVQLNLQELPNTLLSSSLKGHVKGAFTDAKSDAPGALALAKHGTLHLDEIGNLDKGSLQMLLRLVENGSYTRIGGREEERIECQIVMTTNKNIPKKMAKGKFPADLYDRLDKLYLPPLRTRGQDAFDLFQKFVERETAMLKCRRKKIDKAARERVEAYEWPGNVRQLMSVSENVVADREYTGSIYLKDVNHAIARTGAELQKGWAGRYEDLLVALRECSFTPDELDSAWSRLEGAIGILASNMIDAAVKDSQRKSGRRVECVTRLRKSPGKSRKWDSSQCREWLLGLQKEFGASGLGIAELLRERRRKRGPRGDAESKDKEENTSFDKELANVEI